MGEMGYEPEPEVFVPVIRDWYSQAFTDLARIFWGRRGGFIVWGWLFLFYAFWVFVKVILWVTAVALITVLFAFTAIIDMITYRHRHNRALVAAWADYLDARQRPNAA